MSFALDYSGFKVLLLAVLLPPAPWLLLAAWGGWRLHRQRRGGGWMLVAALLLIWFTSTEAVAELLSRVIGNPPALAPEQIAALRGRTDGAVLVLGGGVRSVVPEYGIGAPKEVTAERLAYGVFLARQTGLPLAFSGGIGWGARQLQQSEASIVARVAAQDYGLPLRWSEDRSRDTRENAANTLPLLAQAGVRRVLLVTHDAHMRRALRAFEAQAAPLGLQIVAAPLGLREDSLTSFSDWCPSSGGFARVRYLVYETLAWWSGR
ncbi:YdcF family protein [Roseateles asaccharophilus]|uniref:Uncharacterized SAM-binding protein YcdF (DUF218 family) n=1 Tax=Roseateles asaccharophilus TaxID=582607 RepID=A0ABU2A5Q8_9BURK|nr:YdcF family protein [Roseateles asaccharophilus]MDR7332535.1 uncharacterized SAM-binding protein YcdF (DUF218 family) [Roseateles asaccharophilus]